MQVRKFPSVLGLLLVLVPYQLAHDANPAVWGFYTTLKFDWTSWNIGQSLFAVGASIMFVNAVLVAPTIARLGERGAVYLGFGGMSVGFAMFAFAPNPVVLYGGMLPFALIGVAQPAIRSMMANRVPADAQGELQGATSSLMSLTMIVSPLVMTGLFRTYTADDAPFFFPGAPFLAASILALAAIALFARATHAEAGR